MDVVLDTNIFREDFLMDSSRFRILFDYLRKTDSKVVMPQIVYEEIAAVYEREISDRLEIFKKAKRNLEGALIDGEVQDFDISIAPEVKKYLGFLRSKLKISSKDIVSYKNSYLEEVVRRATRRVRPCSEKGEEFRDALLWLTVLDIARIADHRMLIFISNNVKQFASEEGCLHPTLLREAEDEDLSIRYYNSLSHFIKEHATRIDYITPKWLRSAIHTSAINDSFTKLLRRSGEDRLLHWARRQGKEPTGRVFPYSSLLGLDDFHVYEMTDGSIYVEASYSGAVMVEFEWEEGEFECLYPVVTVTIEIAVDDKKVKSFEIVDWDFRYPWSM